MANVKLPERFETKLKVNQQLEGIVKSTLYAFGEILHDDKLYFFEGYTKHGIEHIEKVLASANEIITDNTFNNILTEDDIACLILAVILHDIGMHINFDGFKKLVSGEFDDVKINEFDKLTWKEQWVDFLSDAKRFSGKQLRAIFGDENTTVNEPNLSEPKLITNLDRMLIGEFLRRYHGRLAHEIAIKNFPGKSNAVEFAKDINAKTKNLIGLIARSHTLEIRKCMDYVEFEFSNANRRTPNNVHIGYLMILLRIADFIQIDSTRTSATLLNIKTFSSPISELEHYTHIAVDQVDLRYQDDPERIYVSASPNDSKMYLKLIKLIKEIQYEFDMSWAVLGELYGTLKSRPEIKFRRITSNLEDNNFLSKQKYIADSFAFRANDQVIKLLIAPLYGDDPKYGVRELLQNSIDACKEMEIQHREPEVNPYKPSISIEIKKESEFAYFTITDNGVGMDTTVIRDYFLSAGASYRKSTEWLKKYQDANGDSKVRRSGRFGIGILAAFLIGDEIYVETRNYHNDIGYKFHADLNTEQINVLVDSGIKVGTVIKIKVHESALDKLKVYDPNEIEYHFNDRNYTTWFNWYTLAKPKIHYDYLNFIPKGYANYNPDIEHELPDDWNSIDSPGFNKILWTYSDNYANKSFCCNGIVISRGNVHDNGLLSRSPIINVFDNNGYLPLSLDRESLTAPIQFNEDLLIDIYKDFIAYFLVNDNIDPIVNDVIKLKSHKLSYPGCRNYMNANDFVFGHYAYTVSKLNGLIDQFFISKKGFVLNYNYFINRVGKFNALLMQSDELSIKQSHINLDIKDWFFRFSDSKLSSIGDYRTAVEPLGWDYINNGKPLLGHVNIFLKTERYKYMFDKKRLPEWLKSSYEISKQDNIWTILKFKYSLFNGLKSDENSLDSLITASFLNDNKDINFVREYEVSSDDEGDPLLDKLLEKYIGDDVVIPYNIEMRKQKYPVAFTELERYMRKYR